MTINDRINRFRNRRNNVNAGPPPKEQPNDLGFGSKFGRKPGTRLINQDGDFNVERRGSSIYSPYQSLVEMSWGRFLVLIFLVYVALNLVFAIGFLFVGLDNLSGVNPAAKWFEQLAQSFFFSVQTFTTVGYGAISPIGTSANILSSITALAGLLSAALATGLVFARFAKPKSMIKFSEHAIIGPYLNTGLTSLQFRIANRRDTKLINLHANVVLSWLEDLDSGAPRRRFAPLVLERDSVPLFPLNWTIVHPIGEDSPIFGWSKEDFRRRHSEILIMIEGYDQTYAQTIHANSSYTHDEVHWNVRFAPMYEEAERYTILHLDRINHMVHLEEEE